MAGAPGLVDISSFIEEREGRAFVAGTRVSIAHIAALHREGLGASEIADALYGLPLEQVYASIAFYLANREAVDADVAEQDRRYNAVAQAHGARRPREE
jgi:uncharacterized protein (DUF433 family)